MPLGRLFDGFVEQTKRVSPSFLVNFNRNTQLLHVLPKP
jgi:hypothetical protein